MPKTTKDKERSKTAETKIVKAKERSDYSSDTDASKVKIRAVDRAVIEAQIRRRQAAAAARERGKAASEVRRSGAPQGERAAGRSGFAGPTPYRAGLFGKPLPKNAVPMRKSEVPQNIEVPKDASNEEAKEPALAEALPIKPEVLKETAKAADEIAAKTMEKPSPETAGETAKEAAKEPEKETAKEAELSKPSEKTEGFEKKEEPAAKVKEDMAFEEKHEAEEKITEKETQKAMPVEKSTEKTVEKPIEKPMEKAMEEPAQNAVEIKQEKAEKEVKGKPLEKEAETRREEKGEPGKKSEDAPKKEESKAKISETKKEAKKPGKEDAESAEKNINKRRGEKKSKFFGKFADKKAGQRPAPVKKEDAPAVKKTAPSPEPSEIDYTPGIGVKIIRRAADEPKPIPQAKPVRSERRSKDFAKKGDQRKPKEFVGKRQGSSDEESSPRKKKAASGRGGVTAYAPAGEGKRRRSKDKDKDKRRNEKFDAASLDLTKLVKKKHSKYKAAKPDAANETTVEFENLPSGSVVIDVPITVAGFCEQIGKTTSEAIMALMKMGIMANINQNLDEDTAIVLGDELGVNIVVNKIEETDEEEGLDLREDTESELQPRPPVITVMGHVDHGKTSLLDAIRNTNKTEGEAGGITQHIGASEVKIDGRRIVFLDTPGHEAFTAMRARGAHITDIAVLVVAADDSVKPQTLESISHAKAAGVPIIVAINKMDKPSANPDLVKKDLADAGVLVEEWGGNVISVPVSAKTGQGIDKLLEMILLQAEVLELKANPDRLAKGTVIEARLDKARGPVATLLVANGTLQIGAPIVAGTSSGRVRVMTDSKGNPIRQAGPATPVEVTGLTEVPVSGDEFYMVRDERVAREIAAKRKNRLREQVMAKSAGISLEQLYSRLEEGEIKNLNLIIKADVQGSAEALESSLEKEQSENVRVKIIHSGVGTINESDVMLASTSDAVIIGFNVRPSSTVKVMAEDAGVEIRTYRVIYDVIDDVEAAIKGMLKPEFKEVVLGEAEVRSTFKVPNVGTVAGAYVTNGKIQRNASIRLVRDGIVVHEGSIASLKRFKDDVKEVLQGFECGIGIEKYNDIKEGDTLEAYEMQEVKRE